MSMTPPFPPTLAPADPLDFAHNVFIFVMNYMCYLILEADKATRSLGEEAVKEMITEGIVSVRQALDSMSRQLPQDEFEQREYAQRLFEVTSSLANGHADQPPINREGTALIMDATGQAGGVNGINGLDWPVGFQQAVSVEEMHRVGKNFGALELQYSEQDIASALGAVRTMISDVQNVLLEFDDGDLEELSQITLISLRIMVGFAKRTHQALSRLYSAPGVITGRPGNNSAGPSLKGYHGRLWQSVLQEQEDSASNSEGNMGGLPWEPLTPRLLEEVQRLASEGKERPLTATMILAALLPFSGIAVFFAAPVLAGDAALQWGASTLVGRAVGQGTQNAVELGKLGWITSKLATKQTLRFAGHELHRVGGVTGLVCLAGEGALWTAVHPLEATMAGVELAADFGKEVFGRAVWVVDLLAVFKDEAFAGSAEASA